MVQNWGNAWGLRSWIEKKPEKSGLLRRYFFWFLFNQARKSSGSGSIHF